MKTLFQLVLLLLFVNQIGAQTYVTQVKPFGEKLWTYANLEGELLFEDRYQDFYKFSKEGIAAIYDKKKKKFYFINLKGERLKMEAEVDDLFRKFKQKGFEDGMCPFKSKDKWGILNAEGHLIFEPKLTKVQSYDGGYTTALRNSSWIILDKKGVVTPIKAENIRGVKQFTEGLAPVHFEDNTYSFIGTDGSMAMLGTYKAVGYFSGGLAWAKNDEGKLGYINDTGDWVIKPQFGAGKNFDGESGMARVKQGDAWCYVSKSGEMLYMKEIDVWGDFSEGLSKGRKDGKFGFFNNQGEWVIKPQFDRVRDFKNGYAGAAKGKKWGFIDKSGNWVIEPKFAAIKDMEVVEE